MRLRTGLAGLTLFLAAATLSQPAVAMADQTAGPTPTIALDRPQLHSGEKLLVTFNDWQSPAATLSVCGNLARRGAADCNMIESQGVGLQVNSPRMIAEFQVELPPAPCPCVIKASSVSQNEVAFAGVTITDAPVGPVVDPGRQSPLVVSIQAHRTGSGFIGAIKSSVGGPTTYDVTVSVRNRSPETVSNIVVTGGAGRGQSSASASFDLPPPGPLVSGQTWTQDVKVTLPAPVIGRFVWQVTASGAGPAAHAGAKMRVVPAGFVLLILIFFGDLAAIAGRRLSRGRERVMGGAPGQQSLRPAL